MKKILGKNLKKRGMKSLGRSFPALALAGALAALTAGCGASDIPASSETAGTASGQAGEKVSGAAQARAL